VQVRLLGPVDVVVDGTPRPVNGLRRKAVLAALALQPGEILSTDRLVDIVWGDRAPVTAATTLQSHMSDLRRVLGDRAALVARTPGYVLDIGPEATDVRAAERLIRQGGEATDPRERESHLRAAIALWRDRPLADVTELEWFADPARRLEQLLVQARITLVDARLSLGQHLELIGELEDLGQQHPLYEQVHGQLMLALYRAGRQGEALAAYQRLRRALDDELGVAPGLPLRDLETAILRQDPVLDAPPPTPPPPPPPPRTPTPAPAAFPTDAVVPAQLPLPPTGFTGRAAELAQLDGLVAGADDDPAASAEVRMAAIAGTAGVGKTALAVSWAHRVADRFPDGQLYVNLRGFEPAASCLDPSEALRGFIEAFGVALELIPTTLDAQIGRYRSLLAGRRVLVVLDNARDAAQVRPLLPGSPGCVVVVTSRSPLTPLVASEGARPIPLDLPSPAEAHDLLAARVGPRRTAAEPEAAAEIIARCARLPLALVIAAARAATRPAFPLAALAAQLRDAAGVLDALHGGDTGTDVRGVFSWSYHTLSRDAARLFRLLGLHPGPDIGVAAAASLAGLAPGTVSPLLAELADAHLFVEPTPGRWTCHDLLRTYAAEQGQAEDEAERDTAVRRMLDHYLHTTHAAAALLVPRRQPIDLEPMGPGVTPEDLADHDAARDWFTAEGPVLMAVFEMAATAGYHTHTWQLSRALTTYLLRYGRWAAQAAMQRTALEAARGGHDRLGEAHAMQGIAIGDDRAGRLDDADAHFRQALNLYHELDDIIGQAHSYSGLSVVAQKRGRLADGLEHNRRALSLYGRLGNRLWQAHALNSVGWSHALLGDFRQALSYCRQALALLRDLGDRDGEAATLDSLGYAHRGLADYAEAIACYRHAVDLYRELDDPLWEADSLNNLGDTHEAAGDPEAAREAWRQALHVLEEFNHPRAEQLRAKLDAWAGPGPAP
jgi:DNA-binding SARP family transcriptional activator/tetratricopeptide (TPR) repeat protein